MALRQQKNIEDVLVCKDLNITGAPGARAGSYPSAIAVGEAAVFSPGGVILNSTTVLTVPYIKIGYVSTNGELVLSDSIDPKTIKHYVGKVSAAAAEQIDYVGYNGTSGAIEAINSNTYLLRLWFTGDTYKAYEEGVIKYGVFKSSAAATDYEVANGVALNLYDNIKNENEYRVLPEVVSSATTVASSGGVWTVVKGSTGVSVVESAGGANDAGKYNADAATLVAGDFIRFGHATTKTYPVYRIVSITGAGGAAATIVLDRPYVGASNASLAAASVGCMDSATGLAGDFGIKLTGVAKTWSLGKFAYNKVRWTTTLTDFGTTTVTNSQAASLGIGTPEQIAEAEWFAQGNEGGDSLYRSRFGAPAYTPRKDSESSHYYSVLSFEHSHVQHEDLGRTVTSPKRVFIALNAGATAGAGVTATSLATAEVTSLLTVLDALVVANGVGTAQIGNI